MPILDWLDKDKAVRTAQRVPYRLLEQVPELSYGDGDAENMLIQGDNLEALKALIPLYAGKVKCIYIDPPYNTKSAFEHYDDNLEHSQWLSMMYPRLELLRELLSEDGSIWVSIDDNEAHYLKVMMDEIFGRRNYLGNVLWQKRTSPDARLKLSDAHDHIHVYAHSISKVDIGKVTLSETQRQKYKNPDNDLDGPWVSTDFTAQGFRPNQMYEIETPSGVKYGPPEGRCWANIEDIFIELKQKGRIWFGKDGKSRPRIKNHLKYADGIAAWTWWTNKEVGHNQESKKEINNLFGASNAFDTPKPERLIQRILGLTTAVGDLVLDSCLGSGTTAAVAHKMGRHYIGIEMGEHAVTHCQPRIQKVIDGEQSGISKAVSWHGGSGFKFYRLGDTVFDEFGLINPNIKFAALASHLWYMETRQPLKITPDSPLLGIYNSTAYYLLYNGILGDKRPQGGNVLTGPVLDSLPPHDGPKVIYGEATRFGEQRLANEEIVFKQIPYDVKAV